MDTEAYADMLPWLVFLVIDRKSGLGVTWGGGAATLCSIGLVAWSYWRGRFAPLPRIALVLFTLCLFSGLASPGWAHQTSLPRSLTVLTLSAAAFVSLRFTPLSEAYTSTLVAADVRDDPRFHRVNVDMTLAWGFGALAVSIASAMTVLAPGPVAFTFLAWVAPLALSAATVLWAARRWELFRLSTDSLAVGRPGRATPANVESAAPMFPVSTRLPRRPPSLAASDPVEGPRSAVIHQLPLRRRRNV